MSEISWRRKTKDVERQQELKRRVLLDAAAHAFSTRGYANTSLEDLANLLDVTKPALYYYVKSKEDILMQCIDISLALITELFEHANRAELNGLERVKCYFHGYAVVSTGDYGYALIREGEKHLGPANKTEMRKRMNQGQRAAQRLIASGVADHSICPCEPKYVAFVLLSTFNQMKFWYDPEGELSLDEVCERLLDIVVSGISGTVEA